jgi:PAS domain S-box-containing protein
MIGLTVFVYFFSDYLIKQQYERVKAGITISAKGLANVIDERIDQQRLMVKALAIHNEKQIYELATGGSYPFDLFKLSEHIKDLLPNTTQFAILDAQGYLVAGSERLHIGAGCHTDIQHSMAPFPREVSFLGPHSSPDGSIHYDVTYLLKKSLEKEASRAVLFLSFNFEDFHEQIVHFNTDTFEFILVKSEALPMVIVSASGVAMSEYGSHLNLEILEQSLAKTPVLNGQWLLLGLPKQDVFARYVQRVCWMASLFLGTFLIFMMLLLRYLRKIEQARQRLESNSVQDALFNTGPTVLFQKKADSNMAVEYVSPNVHALLGCGVQEVLDKGSFVELILLEDVASVRMVVLNACTHHEQEVSLEYRVKFAQYQGYHWVYDLTRIVYDEQGKPTHLQSYVTSIHAQKMAEQRASRLIESAPDAMAVTDRYGVVLRVNQAFEKMFGYARQDLVGLSLDLCIYEKIHDDWHQRINLLLSDEGGDSVLLGTDGSISAITREGQTFTVEVGFSRVNTLDDIQLVHTIRDVSIQLQAQTQMQLAKERAEALAKARSRFVATMSHEIRTPLNGVLGMSNLLMNTSLTPQQSMYLQAIEQSGQALLKVVNNILDFAKLDEGGVNLEEKVFDLNSVVRDSLQILNLQAIENEVELLFESNLPSQLKLIGDAGRVQQILLNLLSNAIKFSPQGRVDIVVTSQMVEFQSACEVNVLVEIKDTGIGISADSLEQLFDSFTQADDSTTRKFGGTGLGLTISKQLVELMGGTIGVVSEESSGSLFWIEVPFKCVLPQPCLGNDGESKPHDTVLLSDLSDTPKKIEVDSKSLNREKALPLVLTKETNASTILARKTILLIEDNETNQEIVMAFVHRLGGRVDIAKNGLEGLSFWRMDAQKYDLILMDCQMPVMDGYEATILIRKEEVLSCSERTIPIVALTANAMPEDRERCFSVGMNDYITKPIDIELFNQTLVKWIISP